MSRQIVDDLTFAVGWGRISAEAKTSVPGAKILAGKGALPIVQFPGCPPIGNVGMLRAFAKHRAKKRVLAKVREADLDTEQAAMIEAAIEA